MVVIIWICAFDFFANSDDKIVASIVTGAGDINIWNIKNYEKINLPKSSNFIDYLYSSSLSMVVKLIFFMC